MEGGSVSRGSVLWGSHQPRTDGTDLLQVSVTGGGLLHLVAGPVSVGHWGEVRGAPALQGLRGVGRLQEPQRQ